MTPPMTVAELIKELSEFPPDAMVFCSNYDDSTEQPFLSDPFLDDIEVIKNGDEYFDQLFDGDERAGIKAVAIR
jgi:hypothetical protein